MRPGIPTPNSLTKKGEILTKNMGKLPEMAEHVKMGSYTPIYGGKCCRYSSILGWQIEKEGFGCSKFATKMGDFSTDKFGCGSNFLLNDHKILFDKKFTTHQMVTFALSEGGCSKIT